MQLDGEMKRVRTLVAAFAVLSLIVGYPAGAQQFSETDQVEMNRFAMSNVRFVLFHELSHMLIDQFGIPVLGREEDAADNIATFLLLQKDTDHDNQTLVDAVYGWLLMDRYSDEELENADFADEHGLDLQRAYQIGCLMVGKDPELFGKIATQIGIDEERQETCQNDYYRVARSMEVLLRRYVGTTPDLMRISFAEPELPNAQLLAKNGIIDFTAVEVSSVFDLPNQITISVESCDEADAYYDPEFLKVTICLELMQDYQDLIAIEYTSPDRTKITQAFLSQRP